MTDPQDDMLAQIRGFQNGFKHHVSFEEKCSTPLEDEGSLLSEVRKFDRRSLKAVKQVEKIRMEVTKGENTPFEILQKALDAFHEQVDDSDSEEGSDDDDEDWD